MSRTVAAYLQAAVGERDAVAGVITCVQTFGAIAQWHPHLHLLVSDGVFRRDGTFVAAATYDPAVLSEAVRRAVLTLFARAGWLEEEVVASMLAWPHGGFTAHVGPPIAATDRDSVLRVARYGARAPVAESRLRYDACNLPHYSEGWCHFAQRYGSSIVSQRCVRVGGFVAHTAA